MPNNPVILYRYDSSPFSQKVDNILLLKGVSHHRVNVRVVAPRSQLSELLGIDYRRIPVLAIGNDVYCDSSLICATLERRFPESDGFGTIFPPRTGNGRRDTGLIRAFASSYADRTLFPLAPLHLDWESFPASFVSDRSTLRGYAIDVEALVASRPLAVSSLASHLAFVEQQMSDGRQFLFDTISPSLADISLHFIFAWVQTLPTIQAAGLFDANNHVFTLNWIACVTNFLESRKQAMPNLHSRITGQDAATLIMNSDRENGIVGFDSTEASRLGGLDRGEDVMVYPTDTGRQSPTIGKLVGLTVDEVMISIVTPSSSSSVHCHFPRLGYSIKRRNPTTRL